MILELPFSNDPAQVFTTQLGEAKYTFEAKYNDRSGVWTLDLYDASTQALIVASLPLVIGPPVERAPPKLLVPPRPEGAVGPPRSEITPVKPGTLSRISSDSAASPCISPSTSSCGARAAMRRRASRIFSAEAVLRLPKLE